MPPQQKSQQPRQQPPQHSQDGLPVQQTQVTPRNCITVFNAYKSRKRAKKNAPAKQGLLSQVVSKDSNDSDSAQKSKVMLNNYPIQHLLYKVTPDTVGETSESDSTTSSSSSSHCAKYKMVSVTTF